MPTLSFDEREGATLLMALLPHDTALRSRVQQAITRDKVIVLHDEVAPNTCGGGWHPTACVGRAPEHAAWTPAQRSYPPRIAKSARLEAFVTVDSGIADHTRIGEDCYLLARAHVGHDVQIGDRVTLATGVILGGHSIVEDDAHLGLGAIVLPFRRIGAGARVGAGSVVTKDVPAGAVVAGNPARLLDANVVPFTQRRTSVIPDAAA